MFLRSLFKLINPQPVSATERKPKVKRRPKAKRPKRQTDEWESVGYTWSDGGSPGGENLDQVPEWLKKEWSKVRGTTRTLGGKWRTLDGLDDPAIGSHYDGNGTGYFRSGKTYRYMVVDWIGWQGRCGVSFYRKRRSSK